MFIINYLINIFVIQQFYYLPTRISKKGRSALSYLFPSLDTVQVTFQVLGNVEVLICNVFEPYVLLFISAPFYSNVRTRTSPLYELATKISTFAFFQYQKLGYSTKEQ